MFLWPFPYIDGSSFSPYKPLQKCLFWKVGHMQFFHELQSHVNKNSGGRFKDMFLVKIASKGTSLTLTLIFWDSCAREGLVSAGFREESTGFRWFWPVSGRFGWHWVIPLFSNYEGIESKTQILPLQHMVLNQLGNIRENQKAVRVPQCLMSVSQMFPRLHHHTTYVEDKMKKTTAGILKEKMF